MIKFIFFCVFLDLDRGEKLNIFTSSLRDLMDSGRSIAFKPDEENLFLVNSV